MWCLQLEASRDEIEAFTEDWEDDCLSISWFEAEPTGQRWLLKALFEDRPSESLLPQNVVYDLQELPATDWLANNRRDFPPLTIGDIYIYGSHHQDAPPTDKIAFKIDAATAFGTGEHETTQGCLLALQDLKKQGVDIHHFLDLGCGTAILAMAAARLFQISGWASDNDPEAVGRSLDNVQDNGLAAQLEILEATGFDHEVLRTAAPFDLIIANILADPLLQLAEDIARFSTKQGLVILSGLLQTQALRVEQAYHAQSFVTLTTYPLGEWTTLVLQKQSYKNQTGPL